MSNVEFNEESNFVNNSIATKNAPITKWLIKKGWVKSEKSAEAIMITITVLCFAVAFYLLLA